MNRDAIIRMAREAGAEVTDYINYHYAEDMVLFGPDELARFAALVEQHLIASGYRRCSVGQRTTQHCGLLEQAVAAEREACAKVCDAKAADPSTWHYELIMAANCAAAIRARGEK